MAFHRHAGDSSLEYRSKCRHERRMVVTVHQIVSFDPLAWNVPNTISRSQAGELGPAAVAIRAGHPIAAHRQSPPEFSKARCRAELFH